MKSNYVAKQLSTVKRWMATALFCMLAIAFVWQGAFFSNTSAMADPAATLIADAGDRAQEKASRDAGRTKNFIDDAADKVKQAAKSNAKKVDQSTDNGSFIERKAKKDAATIQRRANEDASRTKEAVDNTKNVVERTVDNIKDAFGK
ncbi:MULTISPECIES: hypothetical protein [unclassified Nostoc]|uniref:hypothetical protein n=1 Tax=unclassified Nostoc TaxID=2593658 RepID=UPI0025AA8781|nr:MULTISPECIES: hypothetical protein [unclassified Nostoc]MDM9582717.1 hypothetical protein [Nostoc sp. GT001]MDZ7944090.1 hypothetical protein [Nostoc sp. EfeVER01]MDZ7991991.1 hypothetical protein [Nostoc sp. EspVER01]